MNEDRFLQSVDLFILNVYQFYNNLIIFYIFVTIIQKKYTLTKSIIERIKQSAGMFLTRTRPEVGFIHSMVSFGKTGVRRISSSGIHLPC